MKSIRLFFALLACCYSLESAIYAADEPSAPLIGYTEFQTNLPGGRQANVRTMRAMTVQQDGTATHAIAAELVDKPNSWTQFVGWSPAGRQAIVARGWEDPKNAQWEEEHKDFRFDPGMWELDSCLVDLATNKITNVTAVERVSNYNGGLFFLPGGKGLGFTPLIKGISKPYVMDLDGRNKRDVSGNGTGFTYGYSASPDGQLISYHENYQVYIANADGTGKRHIETGNPFNFAPAWSPDGQWLLFVSGEHYNCHPHIVRRDGTGLRKLADRNGYPGFIAFLDVPDFHNGSSDLPIWSKDGQRIFFTAKDTTTGNVELYEITLDGKLTQLTKTPTGTLHYHPTPSPDGKQLLIGSKRNGVRQLIVMNLADHGERQLTHLVAGHAAMWPQWQPNLDSKSVGGLSDADDAHHSNAKSASEAPPTQSAPTRSVSKQTPSRPRRVLYNFDGDSCLATKAGGKGPVEVNVDDVKRLIEEVAYDGSHVDTILICINAQVMYYPSKVGTLRGTNATPAEREQWSAYEKQRFANLEKFFAAGVDPYAIMLAETRRRGREALLSFRMNDDHGETFLRSQFMADHPDFLLGGPKYHGFGALDFAHDEVRDYTFRLIEEAACRYDCDGLELDFNRFPYFFKTGTTAERIAKMNALVERVRHLLDDVGRERNRHLILTVRVPSNLGRTPPTPETAREIGCDVPAWVDHGWVDFVTVSEFLHERGDLPIEAWKQAITRVPVCGGIECAKAGGGKNLTADEYRTAAKNLRARQADGVYLFNFFTSREGGPNAYDPPYDVLRDL